MSGVLSTVNGALDLISGAPLKLGSISFSGYEIPERIPFGGKQQVSIKRLIGGRKIVESTGFDPTDPTWSGRFQGSLAQSRARAVQAMLEAGLPVQLSYGGMLYTVVITSFAPVFERKYQIPYTITCTIVSDDTQGSFQDQTLDDLVGADVLNSLGIGDIIGDIPLSDALSDVQAGLSTVGRLTGSAAIAQISGGLSTATSFASGISDAANSNLGQALLGGVSGVTSAGVNAASIKNAIQSASDAANSNALINLLSRAKSTLLG